MIDRRFCVVGVSGCGEGWSCAYWCTVCGVLVVVLVVVITTDVGLQIDLVAVFFRFLVVLDLEDVDLQGLLVLTHAAEYDGSGFVKGGIVGGQLVKGADAVVLRAASEEEFQVGLQVGSFVALVCF